MLNIQETEFCNGDYIEIRSENGGGEMIGHYCGNPTTLPSNMTAANKLWIKFRSDGEITAPGFIADYSLRNIFVYKIKQILSSSSLLIDFVQFMVTN